MQLALQLCPVSAELTTAWTAMQAKQEAKLPIHQTVNRDTTPPAKKPAKELKFVQMWSEYLANTAVQTDLTCSLCSQYKAWQTSHLTSAHNGRLLSPKTRLRGLEHAY